VIKAVWQNVVLAQSETTVVIEGNHYFPPEAIQWDFFTPSETHTLCPWKGQASYYTLKVNGQTNRDAAWYYAEPTAAAANIKGLIAFWRGVRIEN